RSSSRPKASTDPDVAVGPTMPKTVPSGDTTGEPLARLVLAESLIEHDPEAAVGLDRFRPTGDEAHARGVVAHHRDRASGAGRDLTRARRAPRRRAVADAENRKPLVRAGSLDRDVDIVEGGHDCLCALAYVCQRD